MTLETEILTWLHQIKYVLNENWIEQSSLLSLFEKSNEKYQNRNIKFSFAKTIQGLLNRKQESLVIYTKMILRKKTNLKWILVLLNNDYGIYNCNHPKYKYNTIQLYNKMTTHHLIPIHSNNMVESMIAPQISCHMHEVCESNSHTFQTRTKHYQQHHEVNSPPHIHHITHNLVTPPTGTTFTSPDLHPFNFPIIDREMIKNEEVDMMMSRFVERMKLGTSDTNLSNFEEIPLSQKETNSVSTYGLLKMMRIPLIPKLLQLILTEISDLSLQNQYCVIQLRLQTISYLVSISYLVFVTNL